MRFLRSQENVHNMPTNILYVIKNALTRPNTIVPLITQIMCYFVLKELVY